MTGPTAPHGYPDGHPVDELPALILGELPPAADEQVAAHLAGCDDCRRELAEVARMSSWLRDAARLTVAEPIELPPLRLPAAGEPGDPAGNRRARLTLGRRTPGRRTLNRRTLSRRNRWLAGAAAAVVVTGGVVGGALAASSGGGGPTATVTLSAISAGVAGSGPSGSAAMHGQGADQTMSVAASGLAAPPGRDFYEVWLLNTKTNAMLPVGVLPADGRGRYSLPAAQAAGYNAIDVSLEPDDNNPAHSTDSVLRGLIS